MNITKAKLLNELICDSKARINSLHKEIAFEERYIEDLENKKKALKNGNIHQKTEIKEHLSDINSLNLPEAIKAILAQSGKPMRARDIAAELNKRGYRSKLPSVLSALCRRHDLFKKTKRGIYKLKTTE